MNLIDRDALRGFLRQHYMRGYPERWELLQALEPCITAAPEVCCERCAYDKTCNHLVGYLGSGCWTIVNACEAFERKSE